MRRSTTPDTKNHYKPPFRTGQKHMWELHLMQQHKKDPDERATKRHMQN